QGEPASETAPQEVGAEAAALSPADQVQPPANPAAALVILKDLLTDGKLPPNLIQFNDDLHIALVSAHASPQEYLRLTGLALKRIGSMPGSDRIVHWARAQIRSRRSTCYADIHDFESSIREARLGLEELKDNSLMGNQNSVVHKMWLALSGGL